MWRAKFFSRAVLFLCLIGLAVAVDATSERANAQAYYQCPPGYFWDPYYGCVPAGYLYGPPYYAYPDFGFGFFYGPGYGRGYYGRGYGFGRGVGRGGGGRGGGGHR